jgi:hypothetical protein
MALDSFTLSCFSLMASDNDIEDTKVDHKLSQENRQNQKKPFSQHQHRIAWITQIYTLNHL